MDVRRLPALIESSAMMFLLLVLALHVDRVQMDTLEMERIVLVSKWT